MRKNNGFGSTKAIYHQMHDIEIFPVTDDQLDELEKGTNSDLYLEFGLCLISVFASFLCSLLVLDFSSSPKAFQFYSVICVVTGPFAILLLILWWRNRKDTTKLINKIRSQKKEE